jgi:hypothetical protein
MQDEPRITDHDPIIAAARADALREGVRMVHMTIDELWRMIHGRRRLTATERAQLAAGLQPDRI